MLSILIIVFTALMMPGVINRTRALLSGRKGVTLYQHINIVGVQFSKGAVYSSTTGIVFKIAPIVYIAALLTAMLFIPVGGNQSILSFNGDVVFFCYLLSLSHIMLIMGAMDTGSSFEGMGASRAALYGAIIEPALFIIIGTLALISGQTSFNAIFTYLGSLGITDIMIVMVLSAYTLFNIVVIEAGRVPLDDPRTHLELTMIHEVMVLDYCGFDLGLITLGGWLKTAMLSILAASALASSMYYNALFIIILCMLFAIAIGVTESTMARNRLSRNTTYLMTITSIAFLVFMVGFLILQNINFG